MRLHEFILTERDGILAEWESFAATCGPASITMDVEALRDHASEMLLEIAEDLENYQDQFKQSQKSKRRGPVSDTAGLTPAEEHGAERAESGFTVVQIGAEYHALRSTVLKLWTRECGTLAAEDISDLIRFNEAIDQLLAESVSEFNESVEDAKEIFLAILGHDLRSPIGAIYTTALLMSESGRMEESHRAQAATIARYAMRATQMVGDLLDFTRSRLGSGIPVDAVEVDLREVVKEVADEVMAAQPGSSIQVELGEQQLGQWDAGRMSQVLSNLICNAVEHGNRGDTVRIVLEGDMENVEVRIHNHGVAISPDRLDGLFNPMKQRRSLGRSSSRGPNANLGLGLYIAERIVHAHGGHIEAESSEAQGTTFAVRLPRRVPVSEA